MSKIIQPPISDYIIHIDIFTTENNIHTTENYLNPHIRTVNPKYSNKFKFKPPLFKPTIEIKPPKKTPIVKIPSNSKHSKINQS